VDISLPEVLIFMVTPAPVSTGRLLRAHRPVGSRRGQAMVEFALLLPLFALFLVITVDFGRLYFSYIQITNAAREAASFGAGQPTNGAGMQARALQETNAQSQRGETGINLTSSCANAAGTAIACSAATGGAGPGNTITVVVTERFTFLTPLVNNFFGNNLVMRTTATSTVRGYAASGSGTPPAGCSAPAASFVVSVTSGTSVFANPSASTPNSGVCNISGYNWTWGDGQETVGTATGDAHTYTSAGTYTITLEVTNQGGPATTTRTVTVPAGPPPPTCAKPTANFDWTSSGKTYTYRDRSTVADTVNCPITDWLWTFTDLGTGSNAQNPAPVTYGNNSSHPVTLKVTNAGGTATITRNS
jgi:PKD repeat protein